MSQRAYLDSIGREISKLTPNVASLVKQGYIIENDRIIVLFREHAEAIERRRAGSAPLPAGGQDLSPPIWLTWSNQV